MRDAEETEGVDYDEVAERFVHDAAVEGRMASSRRNLPTTVRPELRIIANRPDSGLKEEYDRKLLEASYNVEIKALEPRLALKSEGIQSTLDEIAPIEPRAKSVKPPEMIDLRYLDEMERGGFMEQLWSGKK